MRKLLYIAGLSLTLGNMTPAQAMTVLELDEPAPVSEGNAEVQAIGQRFLQTTSEMWFLLSGISCKTDADKAANRFTELVSRVFELDNQLSALPIVSPESECVGMMDSVQLRILEALDDLHMEFLGICRANCYGSARLTKAFEKAVELGMFAEDDAELLKKPSEPLSEAESLKELERYGLLVEPDHAVLLVLSKIQDEKDATAAVAELHSLSLRFKRLLPSPAVLHRDFSASCKTSAEAAFAPVEPLLWAIRSEIVRIASLPGYEAETYDDFSNALDIIFESLGATHTVLFDSVFDASFRMDLDNALRENSISSQ